MVVSTAMTQQTITFEEFLHDGEEGWSEWVDGRVITEGPRSTAHQSLVLFLSTLLGVFSEESGLGEVLAGPILMWLEAQKRGREPDILFVSAAHADRFTRTHLNGPADLVVEIVSPESVARDRGQKFVEYEAAGIPEYWLIDPERERAEFYVLDAENRYRDAGLDGEGRYHSLVLAGLWVKPAWFWQEPLPPVLDRLREIGVI